MSCVLCFFIFFFFNDTATTEIYTLSLHDALPSCPAERRWGRASRPCSPRSPRTDRKSTRLNSSHVRISYAVFCLKKKKNTHLLLSFQKKKKKKNNIKKHKKYK